jgi:hypothetical protein
MELLRKFIEEVPDFDLQHIYRGLEILAKRDDFFQASVYRTVQGSRSETQAFFIMIA